MPNDPTPSPGGSDALDKNLKPGSFYWVLPVFDVDFTPPGFEGKDHSDALFEAAYRHWTQTEQPARFEGYDENGNEKWVYLGHEVDETNWWPVRWVGNEIAALQAADSMGWVPEGWKMVPIEPTIEMVRAGYISNQNAINAAMGAAYRAMIEAAPPVPNKEG